MSSLRDIALTAVKGGTFLFTGAFVSKALSVASTILIARILSAADYGMYAIIQIVPTFFLLFADWGIDTALVKNIAYNNFRKKRLESWSLAKAGIFFKLLMGFII